MSGQLDVIYAAEDIKTVRQACERMRDRIKEIANQPENKKTLNMTFGPSQAAELLGRTPEALAKAEARGRLPAPRQSPNGRRYYTVEDLIAIREQLGIIPGKATDEDAVVISVQNFKGGVGKSTLAKHFADYLALRGYRVLVLDCDPQASLSTMFDVEPVTLIDDQNVLSEYLSPRGEWDSFRGLIRKTIWPNIDIVPSNLGLQDAEWDLTATIQDGRDGMRNSITRLRVGLSEVMKEYDVVVLDPPPAMGFLALNTMAAANGLMVPVPARQLDYLSTIHFLNTVEEHLKLLNRAGIKADYAFFRMICSMYMTERKGEGEMWQIMQATYAGRLASQPIFHSEAIKDASNANRSIYEVAAPRSPRVYARCRENLDTVFGEIESVIRQQWPSHRAKAGVPLDGKPSKIAAEAA